MRLFFFPVAPNPTKVRIYLAEKGIEVEQVLVNLAEGENRKPEYLAKSPRGTLPALELDDGRTLTESLAIIEYFEERYPEPPLWGTTPEDRAVARNLERICDLGVLIATARLVHATNSPLGLPPNPEVAKAAREMRDVTLERLDGIIGDGPFVAGPRVTVADCTLYAGLRFGAFRDFHVDPRHGNVRDWQERFGERPSANP